MIWDNLSKPFFALAPMNDVTDSVFRRVITSCAAPDIFFTEFVSVDTLQSAGKASMDNKLLFINEEKPLVVQVWGIDPDNYEATSKELSTKGYAGIDINMGCPVAKIIKNGACSALINNRELAKKIIASTQRGAGEIPVSVKTRIGYDHIDLTWIEFILKQNLAALTVHCRTVVEKSNVENHFEVIDPIVKMRNEISPKTKLIINGDISSRSHGEQIAKQYKIDGLMLGRAIFDDPYVFSDKSKWAEMEAVDKVKLYLQHIEWFDETWQGTKNPDILKKFAKIYIVGFDGAHKIREMVMGHSDIASVKETIKSLI